MTVYWWAWCFVASAVAHLGLAVIGSAYTWRTDRKHRHRHVRRVAGILLAWTSIFLAAVAVAFAVQLFSVAVILP